MQNIKTHIVVAIKGESKEEADFEVLHIGTDRRKAREIYLDNMGNTKFDFVGMSTLAGFKSRARPKIDAETRKALAASAAKKQEDVIKDKAEKAKAAKDALGEAALKAEAEEEAAREKLDELRAKSGKKAPPKKSAPRKSAPKKDDADDNDGGADALLK